MILVQNFNNRVAINKDICAKLNMLLSDILLACSALRSC